MILSIGHQESILTTKAREIEEYGIPKIPLAEAPGLVLSGPSLHYTVCMYNGVY
jgi:hypothetical protein